MMIHDITHLIGCKSTHLGDGLVELVQRVDNSSVQSLSWRSRSDHLTTTVSLRHQLTTSTQTYRDTERHTQTDRQTETDISSQSKITFMDRPWM